jgi:hypothetical protein
MSWVKELIAELGYPEVAAKLEQSTKLTRESRKRRNGERAAQVKSAPLPPSVTSKP